MKDTFHFIRSAVQREDEVCVFKRERESESVCERKRNGGVREKE